MLFHELFVFLISDKIFSILTPPKRLKKDSRSRNFRSVGDKDKIFIIINKISGENFYILNAIGKFFINNILIIITKQLNKGANISEWRGIESANQLKFLMFFVVHLSYLV